MAFDGTADGMAERTTDVAFVNGCVNHPEVRPHVGWPDAGALDLGAFLANPRNVAVAVPHGCFLFADDGAGRYELHTAIKPEGRGAAVLPAAAAAFRWLFTHTDCLEIVTKVPGSNRRADLMARRAGFRPIFTRPAAWHDGSALTFMALTLDEWRARDAQLAVEGRRFHAALDAARIASGSQLESHPDDDAHDRAAGAACLMAKAGNAAKAVETYNRWARLAGYQPLIRVDTAPVIDIGDAIVTFRPHLEILKCR